MNKIASFALIAILYISAASQISSQTVAADLVITNANIRTMDADRTVAKSLAALNGRIIAIGSDADTKPLIGTKTRVIDAGGRLVLPGFNDAHTHFIETGQQLSSLDLRSTKTAAEFVQRIKEFAARQPKGRWILGGKWDHESWTPVELPTAAMIDAVTRDNPVMLDRVDGHMAILNSAAMKLASIDKNTKDVAGGVIVRNASGEPTGIVLDAAIEIVNKVVPVMSFDQRLEAAQAASDHAASVGLTSVQDLTYTTEPMEVRGTEVGVYQELVRRGKLKTRVYAISPLADWQRLARTGIHSAFGSEMVRFGALKGYADGSLGSRTAWLFEPYLDDQKTTGLSSEEMTMTPEFVAAADKAGLQVAIHAIGDRANATILDLYKKTAEANGPRDRRFRIEHAQHLRQDDIKRFADQKVIASMQPFHLIDDGRWAGKRLDEKRLKGSYAFRSLLDSGAVLAFGSDSPVAPLNPIYGIYAAVTRRTLDDKNPNGWIPEQKITADEAVRAFTWGSAYAEFQENIKGTLELGKVADLVILSEDVFTIDPPKIREVNVIYTIVDGKVVFERK